MLKAIGKFIDTMPIQNLLAQEEVRADTVIIEVDRFHGNLDLKDFLFLMRGITESGGEAETFLIKSVGEKTIQLAWEIGPAFTRESGTLALDLFAYFYEGDASEKEADYLLRYQLPSIQVKALPDGSHAISEKSYTEFLLKVRETATQVIQELTDASGTVWEELNRISRAVEQHRMLLSACVNNVNDNTQHIADLETAMVKIVILSESEYEALSPKEENVLYVVKSDETASG